MFFEGSQHVWNFFITLTGRSLDVVLMFIIQFCFIELQVAFFSHCRLISWLYIQITKVHVEEICPEKVKIRITNS